MCVHVCLIVYLSVWVCVCVCQMHAEVPMEVIREHQMLWSKSYRPLWDTWGTGNGIWVLCKKSNSSTGEPYIQPPFFSFKERYIQKSYETLQILTHSSQLILFLPSLQNDKRHSFVSLWHCQWSQPCLKWSRQQKNKEHW